ncbi:MAG: hypothetical protein JRG81_12695 [Deltaproteobacteria bacterium]|nr:hypothetical protein [Deltaproteobacteria bacterium]
MLRIRNPGPESPVLVTCNFYITVRRLLRALKGIDAWVLVADSKGVNVWCAAEGEEFNTHSVVSAVKTSGISGKVNHKNLILPPLGAPGIKAKQIKKQTGWSVYWGPMRLKDIPVYLEAGMNREHRMKRVTYKWFERVDTALGSLFPFYFLGAIGCMIFAGHLLLGYLVTGAVVFIFFMTLCPWLPGKSGLKKVILPEFILFCILIAVSWMDVISPVHLKANIIIAMVMMLIYASELGGLSSIMSSDLDPFLARLGIGAIGNINFAGTVRTELLNGYRKINYNKDKCVSCFCCSEICPRGCWEIGEDKRAVFIKRENCTACRACLVQCETHAINAEFDQ